MAFERQAAVTPTRVGAISVILFDPDPQQPEGVHALPQSARAEITVIMSDGSVKLHRANIAEHFPPTTINQLKNFVASVRTKAIAEIL